MPHDPLNGGFVLEVIAIEGNGSRPSHQGCGYSEKGAMFTLNATEVHGVCYRPQEVVYSIGHDERSAQFIPNQADPLVASEYKQPTVISWRYIVRRLTPKECERLQGLPDEYTKVDDTSRDSARYKAIGNGMAQPCADFVLGIVAKMAEGFVQGS